MNKHDIEELRLFLQGEYIEESTSRSLKEVKQHQQTQNKIKNKNVNKSLEQSIRHCFYKKHGYFYFEIDPNDFEGNEQVLNFINKLDRFLNGKSDKELNEINTKTKLFKMLTLIKGKWDPKEFTVCNMSEMMMKGILIGFSHAAAKRNIFDKTGYRFFHLSKNPNITILNPTTATTHGGDAVYNQKAAFFYAVREDKLDDLLIKFIRQANTDDPKEMMFKVYGKYLYEYKPKRYDIFYIDNIDGLGERRTKDYLPESTPVFINTKTGLPVTRIDKNVEVVQMLKSLKDDRDMAKMNRSMADKEGVDELKTLKKGKDDDYFSKRMAYYKYKRRKNDAEEDERRLALNKQRLKSMHNYPAFESYIDETIERFDSFMEEFNLTHNEDTHNE